ncbi:hypothetical protein Taro_005267 [Colocasia esculenta]|uniref:Glutamine amidotransferase type-2 domain-containing protein n=1 Tax=Colocasia esculenta TaxID=4460 RepID=A0A843TPE3_COLES|nr:hypothetical protein [Colocasia esculenta]
MCGIALVLSEAAVPASLHGGGSPASEAEGLRQSPVDRPILLVDDLKAALIRRGPDSIGNKKVFLQLNWECAVEEEGTSISCNKSRMVSANSIQQSSWPCKAQIRGSMFKPTATQFDAANEAEKRGGFCYAEKERRLMTSVPGFSYAQGVSDRGTMSNVELHFLGATLQLRGISPVAQPLTDDSGNILVYNGEIFGGIDVDRDENDGETLLHALEKCACFSSGDGNLYCKEEVYVPHILSSIKGPWALIYWQAKTNTIWFGRDAFGRRSLLVHWPTDDDPQFVLSSVSPLPSDRDISAAASTDNCFKSDQVLDDVDMVCTSSYWDELSCGIYSMCLETKKEMSEGILRSLVNGVTKHEWRNPLLKELIKWDRRFVDPKCGGCYPCVLNENEHVLPFQPEIMHFSSETKEVLAANQIKLDAGNIRPAHRVLVALRESVMRRATLSSTFQNNLHQTLQEKFAPFAVLFSGGLDSMILAALLDQCLNQEYAIDLLNVSFDGSLAPDRISARTGLKELQNIAPSRRWRLVEIDANLSSLASETKHVISLINPARTYMDLNIGISLWLAAGGEGFVDGETCNPVEGSHRYKYKSTARILLVGSGADEQCAGYGRHRTKYRNGGWASLQEEMRLDMQRIWIRNMGRDDRLLSDHGKEARFPFLDEDVVKTLLEIPLWEIAELNEPVGQGDKKILREFGSRIARESNKMHFGSNRAANQASAGTVVINKPPS